jgi:hypothetical protein
MPIPMRKFAAYIAVATLLSACATTEPLKTQMSALGDEPQEKKEQYIYGLPQTVLKVEVTYRESTNIPGPYSDYSERYLGISEVIKQKSKLWKIEDVTVTSFSEPDPEHYYSLNVLEGEFTGQTFRQFLNDGIVLNGTENVQEVLDGEGLLPSQSSDYLRYVDLGIYNKF